MSDVILHTVKKINTSPEIFQTIDSFEIVIKLDTSMEKVDENLHYSLEFYPKGNEYQITLKTLVIYEGKFLRFIDITSIIYTYEKKYAKFHINGKFIDYTPKRITK